MKITSEIIQKAKKIRVQAAARWNCSLLEIDWQSCVSWAMELEGSEKEESKPTFYEWEEERAFDSKGVEVQLRDVDKLVSEGKARVEVIRPYYLKDDGFAAVWREVGVNQKEYARRILRGKNAEECFVLIPLKGFTYKVRTHGQIKKVSF